MTRRILLITEQVHHSRLIEKSLNLSGRYQVLNADSLGAAAPIIREMTPDLIMAPPQLSDGDVTDLLLMMDRHQPLPILILADPDDVYGARRAVEQGCLDYMILDPVSIGDVSHTVDRTLRLWRLEKERPTREMALMEVLKAKEALLKEMYHRVKNNFQTVCSVLSLQSQYLEDETVLEMFTESQDRVRAMALIHERLYRSDDLTHVDFAEYVHQLVHGLFWSYSIDRNQVDVSLKVEETELDMITAIPCGLIINELVSNALKHAFDPSAERKGKLDLQFRRLDKETYLLRVADDGVGLSPEYDIRQSSTLGLQLVLIFAEDQLNGTVSVDRTEGTAFEVVFQKRQAWRGGQGESAV